MVTAIEPVKLALLPGLRTGVATGGSAVVWVGTCVAGRGEEHCTPKNSEIMQTIAPNPGKKNITDLL